LHRPYLNRRARSMLSMEWPLVRVWWSVVVPRIATTNAGQASNLPASHGARRSTTSASAVAILRPPTLSFTHRTALVYANRFQAPAFWAPTEVNEDIERYS